MSTKTTIYFAWRWECGIQGGIMPYGYLEAEQFEMFLRFGFDLVPAVSGFVPVTWRMPEDQVQDIDSEVSVTLELFLRSLINGFDGNLMWVQVNSAMVGPGEPYFWQMTVGPKKTKVFEPNQDLDAILEEIEVA